MPTTNHQIAQPYADGYRAGYLQTRNPHFARGLRAGALAAARTAPPETSAFLTAIAETLDALHPSAPQTLTPTDYTRAGAGL